MPAASNCSRNSQTAKCPHKSMLQSGCSVGVPEFRHTPNYSACWGAKLIRPSDRRSSCHWCTHPCLTRDAITITQICLNHCCLFAGSQMPSAWHAIVSRLPSETLHRSRPGLLPSAGVVVSGCEKFLHRQLLHRLAEMDKIHFASPKTPWNDSIPPTDHGFNHGFKVVRNGFRSHRLDPKQGGFPLGLPMKPTEKAVPSKNETPK